MYLFQITGSTPFSDQRLFTYKPALKELHFYILTEFILKHHPLFSKIKWKKGGFQVFLGNMITTYFYHLKPAVTKIEVEPYLTHQNKMVREFAKEVITEREQNDLNN